MCFSREKKEFFVHLKESIEVYKIIVSIYIISFFLEMNFGKSTMALLNKRKCIGNIISYQLVRK